MPLGGGFGQQPQKQAHLEIVTPHQELCVDLVSMLSEMHFHPGHSVRRGNYVVYLKGRDEVAGVLAAAGAHVAALEVEKQAVVKEVRSRANRVTNCDSANVRRTGMAACRQMEAIACLELSGRLEHMPAALREGGTAWMTYPYANLNELAEAAGEGLTRSAVNHRLRRLVDAAEKAESEECPW